MGHQAEDPDSLSPPSSPKRIVPTSSFITILCRRRRRRPPALHHQALPSFVPLSPDPTVDSRNPSLSSSAAPSLLRRLQFVIIILDLTSPWIKGLKANKYSL